MFSLNVTPGELIPFCTNLLASRGVTNINGPASQLGGQYAAVGESALNQCLAEQRYVRGAQLRALIYNHVSMTAVLPVYYLDVLS